MAKGVHIQCRLHPENDFEDRALEHYNEQIKMGLTPRQIITSALCNAAGLTPDMFPQEKGRVTIGSIETLLSEFAHEIIRQLRGNMQMVSSDELISDDISADDVQFAKNIAAGYMARRNRGK